MSGQTLAVTASPTAVRSKPFSFQRPHSVVNSNPGRAHAHAQPHLQPSLTANSNGQQTRSVSTKGLPNVSTFDIDLSSFDFDGVDFDPTLPVSKTLKFSSNEKVVHDTTNREGPRPPNEKMGSRRKSILGRPQSWVSTSKNTPEIRQPAEEKPAKIHDNTENEKKDTDGSGLLQPPERTSSFASLARRSWMSTSRTPSPSANATEAADYVSHETRERSSSVSSTKLKKLSRKRPMSTVEGEGNKSSESLGKLSTFVGKMKHRPQSGLFKGATPHDADSAASSVTSIAPASTPARPSNAASDSTVPSVTDEAAQPSTSSQARDPLWTTFKNLESEHAKFQSKKAADRMKQVRAALVPFLRSYASHPSNKKLSAEHVEQRANILNKWWTGLLDLLDGPAQGSVSGVDRPLLHEVTSLLMMRPEWRMNTAAFRPLADRDLRERVSRKGRARSETSNNSGSPTDSDFIRESAEHNVRTMFTTNLVRQMAFVVDRMAQRHMPLSLVNFAGKACAYAFFFVPGIAEVLVRLWALTADLIRRVADEFHLPRRSKGESDDIVALFPPNMSALGWTAVKHMTSTLRLPTKLPLAAAKIGWHGPWLSRWRGRETDLFFIFCKYYFVLAEEFVPAELPLVEKGRAPAFVLVNAQILSTLDSTVHRQAAFNGLTLPAADGIDASATALPFAPNNNVMKGMTENRLIVLLKDFLSATSVTFMAARHTFAEAFMALMKASAKRTSLYDHHACFTLCDFLEESLVAYDGYVDVERPTLEYIDWPFWFDVCKKIMESSNAGSEIRVLSLIFSIWDAIASNQSRKESICFNWLLKEDIFYKWFNNWCPMVRAYYMRLLCWRICRDAGSANELDAKIFVTVNSRLKNVWSHYLWQKQEAEIQGKLPPSTAPSWPTPGKRFMIIRIEAPVTQPGLMMGFDTFSTPMGPLEPTATPASPRGSAEMQITEPAAYKKKWNLFGKVLSFGNPNGVQDLDAIRRETAAARKPAPPPKTSSTPTPPASDSDSLGSSPTYEALQYVFRFILQWNNVGTMAPPARILTRPRLPAPAQSRVNAKLRNTDGIPPLPPAGRPSATRAVSGSANTGLIEAAKNADPEAVSPTKQATPRISLNFDTQDPFNPLSPIETGASDDQVRAPPPMAPNAEPVVLPVKPTGFYAQPSTYAGRALAEWSLVVAECNSFVDRRREEGVLGLSEVEVPSLSVEGFRKIG